MTHLPAIRRQIIVRATPERAYRTWRDSIGAWWPLERHAVFDEGTSVAFEGSELVETSATGERTIWGSVLDADPPHRLRFTWHPGGADRGGIVEVAFVEVDAVHTLVTLEHDGWERFEHPARMREEYRNGWPLVLSRFADAAVDPSVDDVDETDDALWLVLDHTPGDAAGDGSVYSHPLFAEHVAFLESAAAAKVLIAAGPFADDPAHGQTVLRVPSTDAASWVALAEADGAVARDLFVLRVRPWAVRFSGG